MGPTRQWVISWPVRLALLLVVLAENVVGAGVLVVLAVWGAAQPDASWGAPGRGGAGAAGRCRDLRGGCRRGNVGNPRRFENTVIGDLPLSVPELRERYSRQVMRSTGDEQWLNWIERRSGGAVGNVQATVHAEHSAELAWVIGTAHQGRGYAREAAAAVAGRLRAVGVRDLVAHIHPEHLASAAVARAIGLAPTSELLDGETVWLSTRQQPDGP